MADTFREGVMEFWKWFPTVAKQYAELLDSQQSEEVVAAVTEKVGDLMPGMCWVFGREDSGHSFTLTGEGQLAKQLLAEFWLTRAVDVPGWQFFGSKQPTPVEQADSFAIRVGPDADVDCSGFVVRTDVDEDAERIHIKAWHPTYADLPEEHHMQILFIFLDELLGEFGTQTWIGGIEIEPVESGEHTRPLSELPAFIESVSKYHQWEKLSPLESYTGYEAPDQYDFPRGDTLFGTTCIQNILFDLLNQEGKLSEDPLDGAGAEFIYVAIDRSVFPDGQEVDVRSNIEDTIDEALQQAGSGRSLGGAFGVERCYVDFLLFDGENSRQIVQEQLQQLQLTSRSSVHGFVAE